MGLLSDAIGIQVPGGSPMRIQSISVSGFRSLKNVIWKPAGLNVLIGPNGTGKSNILKSFELIAASARGELGKHIQKSGGMDPIVWDGQADDIAICLASEMGKKNADGGQYEYSFDLARLGKTSAYRIGQERLTGHRKKKTGQKNVFKYIERIGQSVKILGEGGNGRGKNGNGLSDEETVLSAFNIPYFGKVPVQEYQKQLADWHIYHDINVGRDSPIRGPSIARSEKIVESDGRNLISVLHTLYTGDRDFKKDVDSAMYAAFGGDYDELVFPPAADQRIQLRVRWKSLKREQSAADLSDGTLRFLFLLTVLASPTPPSLIAIDQPETGLHPSMMPIVAEFAADASERTQVIFTTHSAQFLDAFGDKKPSTTVLRWRGGETILHTVEGKELDYWLKEYTLGTLFMSGELEDME
jgi:predicted ATPase